MDGDMTRWDQLDPSLDAAGLRVVAWLDGRIRTTPSHDGPPLRETRAIADDLRALNMSGGVVTDCSQPGYRGLLARQRAWVMGVATPAAAARLRRRVRDAADPALRWDDAPFADIPDTPRHTRAWIPITQGVTRGLLGSYTGCDLVPRSAMQPLLDSIDADVDTKAAWHSFYAVDMIWGRQRALWDALTGDPT